MGIKDQSFMRIIDPLQSISKYLSFMGSDVWIMPMYKSRSNLDQIEDSPLIIKDLKISTNYILNHYEVIGFKLSSLEMI